MAQVTRGAPTTRTVVEQGTGIHPVVRQYVEGFHQRHPGRDPGTKHMLRVLADCGIAPAVVKRSWRLLKAEREVQP